MALSSVTIFMVDEQKTDSNCLCCVVVVPDGCCRLAGNAGLAVVGRAGTRRHVVDEGILNEVKNY